MEQTPGVKRLYVGGLGHTITEAELQERFGKFGNVTDTEIITRKDEQGIPTKTFAYINITLSEKELQKCVSILNKTKWKGGTLQIELAKESFLHRLAQERKEASRKKEKANDSNMTNMVESLKQAGVTDFHVKAVPGTEIPDHKDWIVSKFGRVLPILHLKSQHRNKIMKYDPSKYCHNIKKLNQDLPEIVPVSQLTWHLEERNDSMSKKRQGQFPITKNPLKKKMRMQASWNGTELNSYSHVSSELPSIAPTEINENCTPNIKKKQYKERCVDQKIKSGLTFCRNINNWYENDNDSEEEFRAIVAREKERDKVNPSVDSVDDNLEIVGHNFELKYSTHWSLQKIHGVKNESEVCNEELRTVENNSDYDSADTDEILAVKKISNTKRERNETVKRSKTIRESKEGRIKRGILTHRTSGSSDLNGLRLEKHGRGGLKTSSEKMSNSKNEFEHSSISIYKSESDGTSDSCCDSSECEGNEDYDLMMQSCYRLDLTLEELEKLAGENDISEEDTEGSQGSTQDKNHAFPVSNISSSPKSSTVTSTPKKCICPEEIVASILEESTDEENPKKENTILKVHPFRGIASLNEIETAKERNKGKLEAYDSKVNKASSDLVHLDIIKNVSNLQCSGSASKNNAESHEESHRVNSNDNSNSSNSDTENSEMESSAANVIAEPQFSKNMKSFPKREKRERNLNGSDFVQNENLNSLLKSREKLSDSAKTPSKPYEREKQLQDNEKRLTALQERQKERELQKKLIQGALTNLESQSANKQKHTLFDSDGESEAEVEKSNERQLLRKELAPKTAGKLFESSDDEPEDLADEEDRFKVKPQFEGKAGEKLMHLQSRFGTDERFRMDSRFLESESDQEDETNKLEMAGEEEELALEKQKNLEILNSLLHIHLEHPKRSKQTANARKFKDINTLRYDPTRQDHAVFEKKPENTGKESKAKRKEEAQKLPEVSKEIFYDVAVDLKAVLGSTKRDEKVEIAPWDKEDDVEEASPADTETLKCRTVNSQQKENSNFTFSFFSAEEERSPTSEDPYIIEAIKPSRVAWQEDPHFQDSSSDDEPEAAESADAREISPARPQTNVRFFFFSPNDDRLKEGPLLFCRSLNLDEEREDWESRRQTLLEDCRKKHKDARRKVKPKL